MVELYIAYRHIKKRKFQTFVSVFSIFIALTIFITSLTISNGLKVNMINSILTISPHITVYNDLKEGEYKDVIKEIEKLNIKSISPNIDMKGFVRYKSNDILPLIKATDLDKLDIKTLEEIKTNDIAKAYIGYEFSKDYDIKLGDELNIISLTGKELRVKVTKIFKTGFLAYDKNLVLVPLEIAQILLEQGDFVTSIDVRVKDASNIKNLDILKNQIANINDNIYPYTWADENMNLLSAVKFEEFILILILSMLFIVSSFVVGVILNISVREKTKDIGVLKAVGYKNKTIQNIFILEGLIFGIAGILLSAIASPIVLKIIQIVSSSYLSKTYYLSKLLIDIDYKEMFFIYLFAIILVFISSYLPARKASKLEPVEAIKFNL